MKKQYSWIGGLTLLAVILVLGAPGAHADYATLIKEQDAARLMAKQQAINAAFSPMLYYDDLEDHYEQTFLLQGQMDPS